MFWGTWEEAKEWSLSLLCVPSTTGVISSSTIPAFPSLCLSFGSETTKNDVGKAIKLCISFFLFSWHGIIPYCEPDRRVRDERIAGSKDLSLSPYPRLGGRYNCSQQNTTPFFITYQANYHQCEGERSAVWCVCGGWGGMGSVEWGRGGKKHVPRWDAASLSGCLSLCWWVFCFFFVTDFDASHFFSVRQ